MLVGLISAVMGRTVPSFRIALAEEKQEWKEALLDFIELYSVSYYF
jgi:hypothetical protein